MKKNKINLFSEEENKYLEKEILDYKTNKIINNYEEFVDKFKTKKTTDDCYTPPEVYEKVLNFVGENIDLNKYSIERPFYPGKDYKIFDYKENSIVIDNPPFSILSEIVQFFYKKNIKFFLFAPHLTMLNLGLKNKDITFVITGNEIVYENGAIVKTSFVTNLFCGIKIMTSNKLKDDINSLFDKKNKKNKLEFPKNVITTSKLEKIMKIIDIKIHNNECFYINDLFDSFGKKTKIFGGGFLISNKIKKEIEEIKEIEERKTILKLSEKQMEIVRKLE